MNAKRPIIRYHGGKWLLAPWIIENMPPHRIYTETFGGGASVLLRKPRSYAEIYNDMDGEIVNLFRVARDNGEELAEMLRLTPFARDEFVTSYEPAICPIEQARRTVVRAFMGFGSPSASGRKTGFRANSNRSGTTPAHDFANYADQLPTIIARLRGIVIENRPAIDVMAAHDTTETLHYVDPPYLHETRKCPDKAYRFEMSDSQHRELAEFLKTLKGAVMVSGYDSPLYSEIYEGWHRLERTALADGAKKRIEVLWISPSHRPNRLL